MKTINTKEDYLQVKYKIPNHTNNMTNFIVADPKVTSINDYQESKTEELPLEEISDVKVNIPKNRGPFNPDSNLYGLFGGNQGSLNSKIEDFVTNEKIHEIIARYYPEFDSEDIELLFYRMNYVGCGYVAVINTILKEYLFHDEIDFYDRFGFPPYTLGMTEEGVVEVYNYEYLFLDFFLYYAKNERGFNTIEEVYGNVEEEIEFNNNKIEDGALSDEKFPRTGMKGTTWKTLGEVMQRYLAEKGIELSTTNQIELEPGSEAWEEKRKELEEMGVEINPDTKLYESNLNAFSVKEILNQGKQIIIAAEDFTMYYPEDKDGNGKLDDIRAEDVGPHAMNVVGTAPDGKLVVSTWGEEVLIEPNEKIYGPIIIDYGKFNSKDIY